MHCPRCREADAIRRSHHRMQDWLFAVIGLKPYRCLNCDRRFYSWRRLRPRHSGGIATS